LVVHHIIVLHDGMFWDLMRWEKSIKWHLLCNGIVSAAKKICLYTSKAKDFMKQMNGESTIVDTVKTSSWLLMSSEEFNTWLKMSTSIIHGWSAFCPGIKQVDASECGPLSLDSKHWVETVTNSPDFQVNKQTYIKVIVPTYDPVKQ
jgi:hypothetical protein